MENSAFVRSSEKNQNSDDTAPNLIDTLSALKPVAVAGLGAISIGIDETLKLHAAKEAFDSHGQIIPNYPSKLSADATKLINDRTPLLRQHQLQADALLKTQADLINAQTEAKAVADMYKDTQSVPGVSTKLASKRNSFLNESRHLDLLPFNGLKSDMMIGSELEVQNSTKLFVEGSREAKMLSNLENSRLADVAARNSLGSTSELLTHSFDRLQTIRQKIDTTTHDSAYIRGTRNGFVISAASILGGYATDKMLGIKTAEDSISRLVLDGVITPTALASDLPSRYRVAIAATSFVASRMIGAYESQNQSTDRNQPQLQPAKIYPNMQASRIFIHSN